jgi:hypothetical protein
VQVARLSADAARLPPGGLEASPTYSSPLVSGGSTGIFREAQEGLPARHLVDYIPQLFPGKPRLGKTSEGDDTPDRVGRVVGRGIVRFQSVTRDRTTK